jgi:hypothetical protein
MEHQDNQPSRAPEARAEAAQTGVGISRLSRGLGEAAMSLANVAEGSRHRRGRKSSEVTNIPVSIPGHPEIEAYKLAGNPFPDATVDMLIDLHNRLTSVQEPRTSD